MCLCLAFHKSGLVDPGTGKGSMQYRKAGDVHKRDSYEAITLQWYFKFSGLRLASGLRAP